MMLASAAVLAGCGETSRISAIARLDPPLTVNMLTVSAREKDRVWTWRGADFRSSLERPTPTTRARETGTKGEIEVSFQLEAKGETVSQGSISLPLRRDWSWGVQLVSATSDPGPACFECTGSKAFPLTREYRGPERDSVWILWGGHAIADSTGGQQRGAAAGQ
jgi:hypothetical protein